MTQSTAESPSEDTAVGLMLQVRADGCQASFDRLVSDWRGPVERLCFRMCGDQGDAEDLTQEVFQKLYGSRSRYEASAKFSTYLWTIAVNHCRDFLRGRRRHSQVTSPASFFEQLPDPVEPAALERDGQWLVQQAVGRLPPLYREVVRLRHYQHMTFEDIGRALKIPRGTVASRMAQALRLLEHDLAPLGLHSSEPNKIKRAPQESAE